MWKDLEREILEDFASFAIDHEFEARFWAENRKRKWDKKYEAERWKNIKCTPQLHEKRIEQNRQARRRYRERNTEKCRVADRKYKRELKWRNPEQYQRQLEKSREASRRYREKVKNR